MKNIVNPTFKLATFSAIMLLSAGHATTGFGIGHEDALSSSAARKSIRNWVSCTGTSDDTAGTANAIIAARHGAFTLMVDCVVNIKIGMDIARPIFIDDGTTIEFTESGKVKVDNTFIPAFVIADSTHISLKNWNVEYDASLPLDQNVGGYMNNGEYVKGPKPSNAFNDDRLSKWLTANRGIVFDKSQGSVNPPWTGTTNPCAIFFITGDSSDLRITGMKMYAPEAAGGDRFIPVAFTLGSNVKRNQTINAKIPMTGQSYAIPHDVTFADIDLDGTYMGWVGGVRDALFENIRSKRYGDLQDANGGMVGGVKKWFAPPHLFYFAYSPTGDPALFNKNIVIRNIVDSGLRFGKARDAGGADPLSGYAPSLKIGCVDCRVENYRSARPDGFLDVLPSDGLVISNVTATYDSGFLNNIFPGWRFPAGAYKNLKFESISLVDTATSSTVPPIGNANQPANEGIVFKDIHVGLNRWTGSSSMLPAISGQTTDISIEYSISSDASRIALSRKGPVEITLQATPATLPAGPATLLVWTSKNARRCVSRGAWSGPIGTSGTATVETLDTGSRVYTLSCEGDAATAEATLSAAVTP